MVLYSRRYLNNAQGLPDSARARTRLGSEASHLIDIYRNQFGALVRTELGVEVPSNYNGYEVQEFFEHAELRDVLDGITLIAVVLQRNARTFVSRWVDFADRVMREEGLIYTVRDHGEVEHHVDDAFVDAGSLSVQALDNSKYGAAGVALEAAFKEIHALDGSPKAAIRSAFEAVETCFKLAMGSQANLGASEIASTLGPSVDRKFATSDPVTKSAAARIVESLKDWTNAAHLYRHGHGTPEPVEPTREIAIALVDAGATHCRFLAQIFPA